MSIAAAASVAPALAPVDTRMASLRAIYIIWYRDILRYWRDRWRLVASLAQPLLFLLVFGSGLSSSLGGAFGRVTGISYIQFMYPGIIGMSILFSAIFGAMSIVWDREFGFLKEVLVAPIDRWAVAVGKALGGTTQAMIQGLILLVLAPFVGEAEPPHRGRAGAAGRGSCFRTRLVRRRDRFDDEVAAGLPGGDELPDDADVLSVGGAVPAHQPSRLDDLADAAGPCVLWNRPDPASRALELRAAERQQPRADDQRAGARHPDGGRDHARLRCGAAGRRGRHV